MKHLVFLLEELSARRFLESVMLRITPSCRITYLHFEGKSDLEKNIVRKIKYWREPDSLFVILRDQDKGDCREIKSRIRKLCEESGKSDDCIIRMVCRELETFFLGELSAVELACSRKGLAKKFQGKEAFRNPDNIEKPSHKLDSLMAGNYVKTRDAEAIGRHISLELGVNTSPSFNCLLKSLITLK